MRTLPRQSVLKYVVNALAGSCTDRKQRLTLQFRDVTARCCGKKQQPPVKSFLPVTISYRGWVPASANWLWSYSSRGTPDALIPLFQKMWDAPLKHPLHSPSHFPHSQHPPSSSHVSSYISPPDDSLAVGRL